METKLFYDKTAEKYDSRHTNYMLSYMRKAEEELIKKYVFGKTLDIGCGTGHHLNLVNSIGLDVSLPMLDEAKKKNCTKLVQGSAEDIPFPDKSFDTILCIFTVLNFCDINKAVNEMKRVLKTGGKIIISVTSVWERGNKMLKKKLFRNPQPCRKKMRIEGFRLNFHAFTKEEFISLFRGFEKEYFKGIFIVQNPWWGWHREFSKWEKIKLRADKFQFLNSAARVYLAVFRKTQ
ncbi:MAG: class I SAM-dependent methyltransferase [Candidatus Aenigmarchaeota archaeon]|nr:class I SAM-dependent methyltransferase [Candidatus Aenigmarchaeota archaeon]